MRVIAKVGCLGVVVLLASAPGVATAVSRAKLCRQGCGAAIAACVAQGGKRGRCRRQTLKRCRREGLDACATAGVTTTTTPGAGATTSTTLGAAVNGCTPETATDRRSGSRTVTFGATFAYDPPCIRIAPGQTVTFSGTFASHPLVGGTVASGTKTPDASSPIPTTTSGTTKQVAFPDPGTFPYYCDVHALSFQMFGAVFVEP